MGKAEILSTKNKEFQETVKNAPKNPGVYMYYSSNNEVIYVGKAKNLFNRVNSYFTSYPKLEIKRQRLVESAKKVSLLELDSEVEALILENNLIKKYQPKYNIMMRDDKNYIYVRFEKMRRKNMKVPTRYSVYQDFPRINVVRNKKNDGAEYFGPFPDSLPVYKILRRLRRIYPYRSDRDLVYIDKDGKIVTSNKKPDLYYHLGLDKGTRLGKESKEEYMQRFNHIKDFFRGKKKRHINSLKIKMKNAVNQQEFEKAALLRDQINEITYVTKNIRIDNSVDDILVEQKMSELKSNALIELIDQLGFPSEKMIFKPGFRIECYDISNTQGTNAVGAMSVMIDGKLVPRLYRRFKIRMKNEPNDFAMLQEVLTRRFLQYIKSNHLLVDEIENEDLKKRMKNWKPDESFSQTPDLIIIDGGKGQLASTYKILRRMQLHEKIPIVGLAKREEEIFKISMQFNENGDQEIHDSSMFTKVRLKRRTEELFLVQKIRDEAHRFGITYHRLLRSKKFLQA